MKKVVCITGTPGCGKTSLCLKLSKKLPNLKFINIGDLISEKKLYDEWDDEMNCSIFDEKLVGKEISKIVSESKHGIVFDFHSIGFIKPKLVDKVIVLQVETDVLWDRLEKRGYSEKKIQENVQAEIFMESYSEALEQFGEDKVQARPNNGVEERKVIIKELVEFLS